jgi:nucleoside-diphosphate-sugar epimerase
MRVFVAGASGVIGTRLVPLLISQGHVVTGTCKSAGNAARIRALGAEPTVVDLLDPLAVRRAVLGAEPEAIVHEATALANAGMSRNTDKTFAETNRLRTAGTDALLSAAAEAGVRRFLAQSFAPYRYERTGGMVKSEEDALDPAPPALSRQTNAAMTYLEEKVTAAGGIALRYGGFYGDSGYPLARPIRKRQFPVVGAGTGVMSFVHLEDAATATALALSHDEPGIYNIVDDEPAPLSEWLPYLASVLGAKPPRHAPLWLAKLFGGEGAVMMGLESRGASNAKAKRELGWALRYPSWRQGFVAAYGTAAAKAGLPAAPARATPAG